MYICLPWRRLAMVLGLVAAGVFAIPSSSHEIGKENLVIEHPWAQATFPMQKTGAVYMIIHNRGAEAERLLAVKCSEAQRTELHGSAATAGRADQPPPVRALEIPARGQTQALAQRGLCHAHRA
jgi:copper(I)-binding protein